MDRISYTEAFQAFNSFRILIVGDVMLDAYAWGKVARISPEAPVPVLACKERESRLGGAANVAKNIKALGAEPTVCTIIGEDLSGDTLLSLFQNNDMSTAGILRTSLRRTTVKTRFLSGFHHLLRVDEEDTEPINIQMEDALYERVAVQISEKKYHALIFQDYDKGILTSRGIGKLKKLAQENGLFTVVDPKRRNFSEYGRTTLFKPNFKEFTEGAGVKVAKSDLESLACLAQNYREEQHIETLLITLSEQGVLVCSKQGIVHIPAQIREIADVSGAGDTVIATATLCLVAGLKPEIIARIANMAGSLVCQHPVVVSVDKKELLNAISK